MRPWPLVCLALALAPVPAGAAPRAEDGDHEITLVTADVTRPVAMAFLGPDEFLVLEKNSGKVQHFLAGVRSEVHDFHVTNDGERGLLGIAVHPELGLGTGKDWVYFYYTASPAMADVVGGSPDNLIDRFTWDGGDLIDRTPIFALPSLDANHNGGALTFGPDGKLYAVIGDVDEDGQLQNNTSAGAPAAITGSIVRLNEDGTLPTDNPLDANMDGQDLLDAVYAYGIRNSFGLAFDPADGGSLWDSENGLADFDEINRVAPGFNSGWSAIMGPAPMPAPDRVELPGSAYADPAYSFEEVVAPTAVAFPSTNSSLGADYVEDLLVADFINGQIYRFELTAGRDALDVADPVANSQAEREQHLFASGFDGGVTDLEEGPDGALYVVVTGVDGGLYKIEGAGGPVVHDLALASVKAPKKVTITEAATRTGTVTVTVANAGTATETISAPELDALVTLTGDPLTGDCPAAPPPVLVPPKSGFPVTLPPRKKLKLAYTLEFDCASAMPEEVELEWDAALDPMALGETDAVPANDVCPRAASADDKGCGGKPAGSPIRTDVILK
jgi:glucose/arabinose dehydrogenase